jgi:hypothetical protein
MMWNAIYTDALVFVVKTENMAPQNGGVNRFYPCGVL